MLITWIGHTFTRVGPEDAGTPRASHRAATCVDVQVACVCEFQHKLGEREHHKAAESRSRVDLHGIAFGIDFRLTM